MLFQIQATNSEVNQLVEKRMMNSDPMDDKLSLFRQQVSSRSQLTSLCIILWRITMHNANCAPFSI